MYKITNTINGKIYIGVHRTNNMYDGYLGSGTHIRRAVEKYGKEAFVKEILFTFDNQGDAWDKERELVTPEFVDREDTYNIMEGGIGSVYMSKKARKSRSGKGNAMWGRKHTEASKEKNRQSQLGEKSHAYGKPRSDEIKKQISDTHKNLDVIKCPHCDTKGHPSLMKVYHFDKCIENPKLTADEVVKLRNDRKRGFVNGVHCNTGIKFSDERKENISKGLRNTKRTECPHCKSMVPGWTTRFHFDNCKLNDTPR